MSGHRPIQEPAESHADASANASSTAADSAFATLILSPRRRKLVTAGVITGMFLGALESTVVGTAMPTVIASLGGLSSYSWVFSVYLLTSTVSVPIWGKLSDMYGRKNFYMIGIGIFLIGSALSGQSHSMLELIIFRAIQGLGAGALVPLGLTIIGEMYTLVERARVQGLFSGVWGIASILGPLAGGFITDRLSWRWVFYINIPFGLLAAALIAIGLIEPGTHRSRAAVDYVGATTLTLSMTLLLVALMDGSASSPHPFGYLSMPLILAASIALLGIFLAAERRAEEPMVPLSLFSIPYFRAVMVTGFFSGMALFGVLSYIPLYLQAVKGATATQAGSILTPLLLGWVTFAVVGGRMLLRIGFRRTVFAGSVLMLVGFAFLTQIQAQTPQNLMTMVALLIGTGMGLTSIALLIAAQSSVRREQLGVATSASLFARTIGGSIGVAAMGAVLSNRLNSRISALVQGNAQASDLERLVGLAQHPDVIINPVSRDSVPPHVLALFRGAMDHALHAVFYTALIVAALSFVAAFMVPGGESQNPSPPSSE